MVLKKDKALGRDGFRIIPSEGGLTLSASEPSGLLYGAYYLLRKQDSGQSVDTEITDMPRYDLRILNHWDNLDGTIERGYAGHSLWKWDELPDVESPRYREYARANA